MVKSPRKRKEFKASTETRRRARMLQGQPPSSHRHADRRKKPPKHRKKIDAATEV